MGIGIKFDSFHLNFMRLLHRKIFILLLFFVSFIKTANASDTTQAPMRIAVLVPLYLDSAFSGYEYNLSNTKIPQFFLSGLDFYSGVKMAIDTLQKQNANVEVWIYDTHKNGGNMQSLANEMQPLNFSLIIASLSSSAEQKIISDISSKNSIPVISATIPNDTYLNYNPFFIMVNPTWKTHIDAMYNYLDKTYRSKKIVLLTKKGSLEEKITSEIQALNSKHTLTFSTIILNDNFSDAEILSHLDSSQQNIIVCGSLNENFGKAVIKTLNTNGTSYSCVLFGMPTWNSMIGTLGNASDHLQIVITTPYNYLRSKPVLNSLSEDYKANYFSRPSDMVFKGYETMYHFTELLLMYPQNLINKISDPSFKVSNDYNFEAIRLSKTSFVPDYLENKKLYFIRIVNGAIQSID
jgi:ABC-type branched-subunit amino acid transport system substrate-binding protein